MFRSTKRVLILGNKPYCNLNLSNVIDSFDVIHRFNFARPGKNNGTKFGNLGMCGHMYQNFVRRPLSKKQIIKTYSSDVSPIFLSCWYDFFQENKKKFDSICHAKSWQRSNGLLKRFGSPHRFSKLLSVGHAAVMRSWAASNDTYVCGFTLCDDEVRTTMGETDEFAKEKNIRSDLRKYCHSFSEERKILAWLHNNKKIDASLCMLEDTEKVSFKANSYNTEPSKFILDLLNKG